MIRTFWLTVALALVSSISVSASPRSTRYTSFEPCNYWNYDYQSGTYTCRNTSFRINVFTAQETQSLVDAQERRIQDLERRLTALEQKP